MQTLVSEMSPTPLTKVDRRCKPIDPAVVQCFGKMKDQDVADKFGRKLKWVRKARQKLGIAAYTCGLISPKLMKDEEVMSLLGKWSDRLLAERFGGSATLYSKLRERFGILPYEHERASAIADLWEINREAAMALLGKLSDSDLAHRFGGLPCRYKYLREKAGIPKYVKNIASI
ncbi:hypothetical protein [Pseudomonas syringae]|uniref:hypothetical protein n=1 Tax=Pseudomonas syringae TaxID=317 RepID=UPI001F2CF48D|nr:hypothetical protein [Pseudomonas syringae]MCF5371242.1 hypothetical protein [Pseudomonas syringae]